MTLTFAAEFEGIAGFGRGFERAGLKITGRGRVLTDAGLARAKALAADIREAS